MAGQVVITVEYADASKESRTTIPMHAEEAVSAMRDLCFRMAVGEYAAVYMTPARPLEKTVRHLKEPSGNPI